MYQGNHDCTLKLQISCNVQEHSCNVWCTNTDWWIISTVYINTFVFVYLNIMTVWRIDLLYRVLQKLLSYEVQHKTPFSTLIFVKIMYVYIWFYLTQVVLCKYHSVFLTADGQVYTCGHGQGGRLGHGDEQTYTVRAR